MTVTTSTIDPATAAGPCRVCARDEKLRDDRTLSWRTDESGPVHLCCSRLPAGASSCSACRSAQAAEDEWQTRGKRRSAARARQAKLIVGG